MKTSDETTKDFLNQQLHRADISEEYRSAIEIVLSGLDSDKEKNEQIWNDFIESLNTKLAEWKSKYPVDKFEYELEVFSSGHLRSVTLNLEKKRYSTWVFEVNSFMRPQHEIYFSSIVGDMDELEVSTFDKIIPLIEKTFNSDDYKEMIEELEKSTF